MCVAVVVETASGPTLSELRDMELSNPHGAGLAWATGDQIQYRKGLTADEVFQLLPLIPRPALLHFRWATHGPKVARLTHPFPLGDRALRSKATAGFASAVLIHNGVWNGYARYARVLKKHKIDIRDHSDTAVAAWIAEADESILDQVKWSTAVGRAAGADRMDVTMRGDWEEHEGNVYSNLYWQWEYKRASRSSAYSSAYDDTLPGTVTGNDGRVSVVSDVRGWLAEYEAAQRALRDQSKVRK